MIKIYLLLFAATSCYAQITIADANFKTKLLTSNATTNRVATNNLGAFIAVDANSNGQIELAEANLVYELRISNSNISSLEGIQYFTNLRKLDAMQNSNLGSLDFTALTNLESLRLGENEITSINVTGLTQLKTLDLFANSLTFLDVSTLTSLETLDTYQNFNLTTIDLSGISNITTLLIGDNPITSLNLQNLTNLIQFECTNTGIITLDLSNNPNIGFMLIHSNNMLKSINLKNMMSDAYTIENNLALEFICADASKIIELQTYFAINAPGALVSTNCSLSIDVVNESKGFRIFPNPAENSVNFISDIAIQSVQLYDIQGRLLLDRMVNDTNFKFDISSKPTGMYLIKAVTHQGLIFSKFLKQ